MQIAINASMIHLERQVTAISELDDIDALVAVYWPRVLRYVTFSINDPDLAQSITQDCFLKAYNGRASFRGDCAVSTWLISIANNLIRDQIRLKKFQFWRKARATSLPACIPVCAKAPGPLGWMCRVETLLTCCWKITLGNSVIMTAVGPPHHHETTPAAAIKAGPTGPLVSVARASKTQNDAASRFEGRRDSSHRQN